MNKKTSIPLAIIITLIFLILVYVYFSFLISPSLGASHYNYFPQLLDAFLHKKLNIIPFAETRDLSFFRGRWYLNWGPASIFFILPFYIIWGGVHVSDTLFTLIAGISNIFVFYFLLKQAQIFFKVKLQAAVQIIILCFFALSTPNFYLSLGGMVWHSEEIIATFYLLLCYLYLFSYFNQEKLRYFILSVIFFNLAWLSRYSLLANFFLFMLPCVYHYRKYKVAPVNLIGILAAGILLSACALFSYDYLRYQNPFQTGISYHLADPRFENIIKNGKIISFSNIPYNFYYLFLSSPFVVDGKVVAIKFNLEGNGIIFLYPWVFCALWLKKQLKFPLQKYIIFFLTSGIVIGISIMFYLMYFTTGWKQIGVRYFLDISPLLLITLILAIDRVPRFVQIILLILGTSLNIAGAVFFYQIHLTTQ